MKVLSSEMQIWSPLIISYITSRLSHDADATVTKRESQGGVGSLGKLFPH